MTRPRARLAPRLALRAVVLGAIGLLVGLGMWQLVRREGKLALIAQTEARLAAAPVAAPGPDRWTRIDRDAAYTRVVVTGRYRAGADTLVQAVTAFGGGYWVVTPLDTGRFVVLVNRGFVPADRRTVPTPAGDVTIRGLLRISEPGGAFLRENDPAGDRWYSRDVGAIAARHRLGTVAPYFIDADGSGTGWPRGGLTVVRFANNHLLYAFTWFGLAALIAVMAWRAGRREG